MKKLGIFITVILVLIIGGGLVTRTLLFPLKYKSEIQKYAKEYSLEPELIAAVIQVRSSFENKEYEKGEQCGLFAINDEAAKAIANEMGFADFKEEDIAKPDTSIKIGAWFISKHYKDKDITKLVEKLGGINYQHAKHGSKEEERKKFYEDYYKKYFVEKIKNRIKMYKLLYPTL